MHVVLKLADGTWLVSDQNDGSSKDWQIKEFNLQDINWFILDINRIFEIGPALRVDLSYVEEIGFTDLMQGGLSAACSRLDWIEVYRNPVKR